jgi:dynein heavy chain, axonemal
VPLVALLQSPAMRERNWAHLFEKTNCTHIPSPLVDENVTLGHILSMSLHSITPEVEEITDRATKEQKMETTISEIRLRWSNIFFTSHGSNGNIALLAISEKDFESLEGGLLTLQGMLASRFLSHFEMEVQILTMELFTVNEVYASIVVEIQRTWSYLEPLFVQSEEVKLELPEDTMRFASIDVDAWSYLQFAWDVRCVKQACNKTGLQDMLDGILEQLDTCKKSLSDFLDGRRR